MALDSLRTQASDGVSILIFIAINLSYCAALVIPFYLMHKGIMEMMLSSIIIILWY